MGIDYIKMGRKIRNARNVNSPKITQKELADKLGISQGYVADLENGKIKNPTMETLEKIAVEVNLTLQELIDNRYDALDGLTQDSPDESDNMPSNHNVSVVDEIELVKVPILGVIRAGQPILAQENIIGYSYIERDKTIGHKIFGLRVVGDSMNAIGIQEGDTVLIKEQPEIENGEIAAVLVDNEEATIKKVYRTEGQIMLVPQSTNPQHQTQIYDPSKITVKILGKAIEFRRKL